MEFVASTLNNLGNLQIDLNYLDQAEKSHQEALIIRKGLVQTNSMKYSPILAQSQLNLSSFYQESKINKELSIHFANQAIQNLLPFYNIHYIKNYFNSFFMILKKWNINPEIYLQQKGWQKLIPFIPKEESK